MERTDQPSPQPSPPPEPRTNEILREPATVDACQADYRNGADIRARLGWTSH
ncbi:hypothetical protein AB0D49_08320 [Streptomyces sp. NPDC048290]|uniref:hypothetical protein n=1 Tax=Streptomyces sp. NPDC048290 TaxID=3155811 RepID=UPI00342948C3